MIHVSCHQGWVDEADDPAGNIATPPHIERVHAQSLRTPYPYILLFPSQHDVCYRPWHNSSPPVCRVSSVNTGEFVLHCRRSWHLDMGSGTSFLTDTFHPPPPLLLAHVGLPQQTPTLPAFFTPALAQRILLAGKLLHLLRSAPPKSGSRLWNQLAHIIPCNMQDNVRRRREDLTHGGNYRWPVRRRS